MASILSDANLLQDQGPRDNDVSPLAHATLNDQIPAKGTKQSNRRKLESFPCGSSLFVIGGTLYLIEEDRSGNLKRLTNITAMCEESAEDYKP